MCKVSPHTFMQLNLGSLLNLLIFTLGFRFRYYWFQISAIVYEIHVLQNLEPNVHECHPIALPSCLCLSTLGFSGGSGEWVHIPSRDQWGRRTQRDVHQIGLNDTETKANLLQSAERLVCDFCDSSFMFITVLNATIQCDPCHRNKIHQNGHCRRLSHAFIHYLASCVTRWTKYRSSFNHISIILVIIKTNFTQQILHSNIFWFNCKTEVSLINSLAPELFF